MTIRIGKARDNDFVADDPHVSRHHAQLEHDAEGFLILEDMGSTNGTFVNGLQIQKKRVTPSDTIILGESFALDLQQVLSSYNDYAEQFALLKQVYEEYSAQKVKIQSANLFKTRIYQSIPFAMIGVIGLIIGVLGKGSSGLVGISIAVAICAPVIGVYLGARQSAKTPLELQELINRFKIDYVCPKCGTFLGDIPWESLSNKKQCPVCRAHWVRK